MLKKILILLSIIAACKSATHSAKSRCPEVTPIAKLDANKYIGYWYQAAALPSNFNPPGSRCARATYAILDQNSISVHNVGTLPGGDFTEAFGNATFNNGNQNGNLTVYFPTESGVASGNYYVLNTNYVDYASVYSCSETMMGVTEFGWVLTRQRFVPENLLQLGLKEFSNLNLDPESFERTVQDETCVYDFNSGNVNLSNILMTLFPFIFAVLVKSH